MVKELDLRYVRTQKLIHEAFFELMETIGFDKITVRGLTEKAMINRSTFYLHYMDKFDLLKKIENQMLVEIESIINKSRVHHFTNMIYNMDEVTMILTQIYEYVKINQHFFHLMISKNGNPDFIQQFNDVIKSMIQSNIMLTLQISIPENYIFALISGAQTSVIKEWIHSGMKETPNQIATLVATIVKNTLHSVIVETRINH